jgi:hypothetical protein
MPSCRRVFWQQEMTMSHNSLKKHSELALKAPPDTPIPAGVWLPPQIRGVPVRVSQDIAITRNPPSVSENVVRINAESDPIGLLIAIANGQPIASFSVNEEGEVLTAYETLPLKERLKVIFHLADKVLPRMQVTKKMGGGEQKDDEWAATLDNAGSRS